MAKIPGLNISAPVVPSQDSDTYPSHRAMYGQGGWRSVATVQDLASIASPRREAGMAVYVTSEDKVYILDSDLITWDELQTGAALPSQTGNAGKFLSTDGTDASWETVNTYTAYPNTWPTTSLYSTKDFCDAVALDTTATKGKAYLGEVEWSDLPGNLGNGEVVVEIMSGTTSSNKVITLTLTSGNTSPYMWKYTYWNGGSNVSGWKGFVPTMASRNPSDMAFKVYATDGNGAEVGVNYTTAAVANSIPMRIAGGQLTVKETPTNNTDATSKKYVDDSLSGKVDKTSTENQVYGTNSAGAQRTLEYSNIAVANSIAQRDANGQVRVALTPTGNNDATSKSYVDTRVNAAITEAVVFKGIVPDETYLPTQESATISQSTGSSLSDLAVVVSTFSTKVSGISGTYSFVYDGTNWKLDGSNVDLTQYGITYSGTPVGTDVITVVYTAAPVNGDMYWITAFSSNPPTGMTAGLSGSAIYNGDLSAYQYTEDAIYQPDEQTIDFDGNGKLAVQISADAGNTLEVKSDGLYTSGGDTLPTQTGHNNEYLMTNGSSTSWNPVVTFRTWGSNE